MSPKNHVQPFSIGPVESNQQQGPRRQEAGFHSGAGGVFVVPLFAFSSSELSFELVNGHINALVGVLSFFFADENFVVLGAGDNLHADTAAFVAVNDDLDPIDAVIVPGQLRCLFLGMSLDSFGYLNVFTTNSEQQSCSP
jgi:hypothetical protein